MKHSNDIIGNGFRNLPPGIAVTQPTAPPRANNTGRLFCFADIVCYFLSSIAHVGVRVDGLQ
jgi:hypothetical protein